MAIPWRGWRGCLAWAGVAHVIVSLLLGAAIVAVGLQFARPSRAPRTRSLIPFGAAASPDLTILPVFLAAAAVGTGTAIGSLLAFAAHSA